MTVPRGSPFQPSTGITNIKESNSKVKFSKGTRRSAGNHFASNRGPTVPPSKDYTPTRSAHKPPFHAEIEAASQMPQDSPEFYAFVRDIVNMPVEMAPSVAAAIRQQKWKIAPNPLAVIRTAAHQEARRLEPGQA
jgi:hypothetical protein